MRISPNKKLLLTTLLLQKTQKLEEYEKILGKAERVEKIGGKDKIYAYDKSGISLSLKANTNIVQEVYISTSMTSLVAYVLAMQNQMRWLSE